MEPILSYQGLEITFVELILALAIFLLGILLAMLLAGRKRGEAEKLLSDMTERQTQMQGRLAQFAEEAGTRQEQLRKSLDERLDQVSHKVGRSLTDTQERNAKSMKELHERLALIDRAQKNIETLAGEVSSLQSVLSNKQTRGAFGEKQMQDMIENFLPPDAYSFQHVLSNGKKVDALIHLPGEQGDLAIDAKFPLESWQRLVEATDPTQTLSATRDFKRDVTKHISDIAGKYLIFGETYDVALMFLPSESIYAELFSNFADVVDKGFTQKVMIVSPTTFMATLHTMNAVMKDAAIREQAHILQKEIGIMADDVRRLGERAEKLQSHFNMVGKDIDGMLTSSRKISSRAKTIERLDLRDDKDKLEGE